MTITIPWSIGGGYITLTYSGQGNDSVTITSDANTLSEDRSQNVTFKTTAGSPEQTATLRVYQKGAVIPSFTYTPGSWSRSSNSSAVDGIQYTSNTPKKNGSTTLRCTFTNTKSITFMVRFDGEEANDYLTVGAIDDYCSRNSYQTSYRNQGGEWHTVTYNVPDLGEHYVEFCYSKDNKTDTSPDNAQVYVSNIE